MESRAEGERLLPETAAFMMTVPLRRRVPPERELRPSRVRVEVPLMVSPSTPESSAEMVVGPWTVMTGSLAGSESARVRVLALGEEMV